VALHETLTDEQCGCSRINHSRGANTSIDAFNYYIYTKMISKRVD
jgi:hypothetical protein